MSDHNRHVTLNNGVQMPILGFGVYQIPPDQTEQAVTDALAIGYRHSTPRRRTATKRPSAGPSPPAASLGTSCLSPPSFGSRIAARTAPSERSRSRWPDSASTTSTCT